MCLRKLKCCICRLFTGTCRTSTCIQLRSVPWKCSCTFGCVLWTPIFIRPVSCTHSHQCLWTCDTCGLLCNVVPTSALGRPIVYHLLSKTPVVGGSEQTVSFLVKFSWKNKQFSFTSLLKLSHFWFNFPEKKMFYVPFKLLFSQNHSKL